MLKIILPFFILASVHCASQPDFGERIYQVSTKNAAQRQALFDLADSGKYDFVKLSKFIEAPEHVAVSRELTGEFEDALASKGIEYSRVVPKVSRKARSVEEPTSTGFDYTDFHDSEIVYAEMERLISELGSDSPIRSQIFAYGQTFEGKPMKAVRIGLNSNDQATVPVILVDAAIHGNEWITPACAIRTLTNLLAEGASGVLGTFDLIITPVVNRDGYDAALKRSFLLMYGRKNHQRSYLNDGSNRTACAIERNCGTNINRNFNWYWASANSKEDPCSYNYRGDAANSAPETQALIGLMQIPNIKFYYTLHSYGNLILWPYGQKDLPLAYSAQNMGVASAGRTAIQTACTTEKIIIASTYQALYTTTGASKDYAAGELGIPISLIHEIGGRPLDFHPEKSRIEEYVSCSWIGFKAMALKVASYLPSLEPTA